MLRGINHQQIFEDDEDRQQFIETVKRYKEQCGYIIYAYCLMGNHIHLLIKEGKEELAVVLKRIAGSYVYWYNWKYHRSGHLFQDRFKSEPIEDDSYFLTVLRYIHQNPVKARMCRKVEHYGYSSIKEYIEKQDMVDTDFVFSMIPYEEFLDFNNEETSDRCLDLEENFRLTDSEAKTIIRQIAKCKSSTEFQSLNKASRNECIQKLHACGLSVRQISRLTGVSKKIVETNI